MLPRVINRKLAIADSELYQRALAMAKDHLRDLSGYYPEFDSWFSRRVLPGLAIGERSILLEHTAGALSGLAIVKDTKFEQKLCCLRVLPPFQGSGVGLKLFERVFDILENRSPLLSVAEEQIENFDRVFQYYGFELAKTYPDFYRPKKKEFSYNGLLDHADHELIRPVEILI